METLTTEDLKEFERQGFMELKIEKGYIKLRPEQGKSGPIVSFTVKKTRKAKHKSSQWRKISAKLKQCGFRHIGGGNGWFGQQKNGKWCIGPYDSWQL